MPNAVTFPINQPEVIPISFEDERALEILYDMTQKISTVKPKVQPSISTMTKTLIQGN